MRSTTCRACLSFDPVRTFRCAPIDDGVDYVHAIQDVAARTARKKAEPDVSPVRESSFLANISNYGMSMDAMQKNLQV